MSTAREPNPLRPYYIPPSVGHSPDVHHGSAAANISSRHAPSASTSTNNFGSTARNILADIDYSDYLSDSSPSSADVVKGLLLQAIWKYSSVFLAQPFEGAKMILQVHDASRVQKTIAKDSFADDSKRRPASYRHDALDSVSSDSDLDSPSYFTPSAPASHTLSRTSRGRRRHASPTPPGVPRVHTPQPPPPKASSPHTLTLKSSTALLTTISTLWTTEGAWGVWKGTNSTYILTILQTTITSFTRSFFSALVGLPDPGLPTTATSSPPGGIDILSSPSPLTSLLITISATAIASTLLSPLDIARTKLILTPSTHPPRSILATLRTLPTWTLPLSIAPPTLLHSTLPTLLSASTPLFLRAKMRIDPLVTPTLYALATFISQALELAIKLPLETVLRRGQIHIARQTPQGRAMETVVQVGEYRGLWGTMRKIIYEEGERGDVEAGVREKMGKVKGRGGDSSRRGQGVEGLWRGWRVGMWGLVGVWGAATLGGVGGKGGEF